MDLLSDDLLADVLGRLPPCSLAASRCVRKDWCAIIDTRCLLRAVLLPLRLHGFFCLADQPDSQTYFFSRRRTSTGHLDFLGEDYDENIGFMDHCNGLVLFWDRVVNPATRQWVPLPPIPPPCVGMHEFHDAFRFLAYDPIMSPHYEVVCFPSPPRIEERAGKESEEWPSSSFTTYVFSSMKWRWEPRSFLREGEAAGTIADMQFDWLSWTRHAVYLRGALYVQCQNNSIARIALSSNKYQMIISPDENKVVNNGFNTDVHLGKSEKGVYYAVLWEENRWPQYRVWLLNESSGGQMEWVLKRNISLQAVVKNFPSNNDDAYNRPWIVHKNIEHVDEEEQVQDEFEWDFDKGIILPEIKDDKAVRLTEARILGFHPYKEIAFFLISNSRVVSYHLNSSRVQELGILHQQRIGKSFPYTPCWLGELTENN